MLEGEDVFAARLLEHVQVQKAATGAEPYQGAGSDEQILEHYLATMQIPHVWCDFPMIKAMGPCDGRAGPRTSRPAKA